MITPLDIESVGKLIRELWPGFRASYRYVRVALTRLGRYEAAEIAAALEEQREASPDGREPNWRHVGELLARKYADSDGRPAALRDAARDKFVAADEIAAAYSADRCTFSQVQAWVDFFYAVQTLAFWRSHFRSREALTAREARIRAWIETLPDLGPQCRKFKSQAAVALAQTGAISPCAGRNGLFGAEAT